MGVGFMAVFAVSGSVVLVAHQVHKRLFSNFMKAIEFELNGRALCSHHAPKSTCKNKKIYQFLLCSLFLFCFCNYLNLCEGSGEKNMQGKKVVRFAEDVVEPSSNNKEYRRKHINCATKPALMDKTTVADHDHRDRDHHDQGYRLEDTMPPNRAAVYKGILQYRTLKGVYWFFFSPFGGSKSLKL